MKLKLHDCLPLTCTREGTCCHGKLVWLHPGEAAQLAAVLGQDLTAFRAAHTTDGGIRLRFDGPAGWKGLTACTLYDPHAGCRAHPGRPLACRLYPLGRERQGTKVRYLHEGRVFPCLPGCPSVATLPHMTVGAYLASQQTGPAETAADAYADLAADLAEAAFAVAFDSGLAASGQPLLPQWQAMAAHGPDVRAQALGGWLPLLLAEGLDLPESPSCPAWIAAHRQILQQRLQAAFSRLDNAAALAAASATCLGLALHLIQSLGGNSQAAAQRWLARAAGLGAR